MNYLETLNKHLEYTASTQACALAGASEKLVSALAANCKLHTFGCGHSALVAAEVCYRAGGLAPVNFLGLLPGDAGFVAATQAEADIWRAKELVKNGNVISGDMAVVVSHSGGSPLVLAMVEEVHAKGASIIAVTRCGDTPLARKADLVLATGAPKDDCALSANSHRIGSMSSLLAGALLNALITSTAERLLSTGVETLVFKSVHSPNGAHHNQVIMNKLGEQVTCWHRNNPVRLGDK